MAKLLIWAGDYQRPTRICCVLLKPSHWATLPAEGTPEVANRSLSRLCFLMRKFSKNKRRACDHRVWLLEWPHAPLVDLTAKSGAPANLKIQWTWLENQKILRLWARPTMRSNRPAELAVTREARLGDCKLVFRFSFLFISLLFSHNRKIIPKKDPSEIRTRVNSIRFGLPQRLRLEAGLYYKFI